MRIVNRELTEPVYELKFVDEFVKDDKGNIMKDGKGTPIKTSVERKVKVGTRHVGWAVVQCRCGAAMKYHRKGGQVCSRGGRLCKREAKA